MEGTLGVQQSGAACVGSRKLDDGLNAFAARTAEEDFVQRGTSFSAKSSRKFSGAIGRMNFRGPRAARKQGSEP